MIIELMAITKETTEMTSAIGSYRAYAKLRTTFNTISKGGYLESKYYIVREEGATLGRRDSNYQLQKWRRNETFPRNWSLPISEGNQRF